LIKFFITSLCTQAQNNQLNNITIYRREPMAATKSTAKKPVKAAKKPAKTAKKGCGCKK
jgi:hypothetical protein